MSPFQIGGPCRRLAWAGALLVFSELRFPTGLPAQAPNPSVPPSFARGAPYRIVLDELTGVTEVQDQKSRTLDRWVPGVGNRATPLVSVPPRRPVVVELINANPLLYRYDVAATVVARGGEKSCTGIGGRFAGTGFLTSLMSMSGQQTPVAAVTPPEQTMFQPTPPPPMTRGEESLSRPTLEAAVERLRAPVSSYVATLNRLRALPAAVGDSLAFLAELGESLPLDSMLARLQGSLEQSLPGLRGAAQVPAFIRQRSEAARIAVGELSRYARTIRGGEYSGDTSDPIAREVLGLSATVEQAERDIVPAARQLQSQLHRIELARQQTRQTFRLEASGDYRRITVDAQPTAEFPEALRLKAGREDLLSQPVASLLCEISIGVAFMDRPPRYAVENGLLVDRDASEQRTAPSFMAHVALARLPWVGALAGLGFGSQGLPDFYLGGTVRLLNPLLVNFGAVWQRYQLLPDGARLGSPVTDPATLNDLPRRYRASFFWGFSFGR